MEIRIKWTNNSRTLPNMTLKDLRTIESAKALSNRYRIVRGPLSGGSFEIRPIASESFNWLKGFYLNVDDKEYLIDITYDDSAMDIEVLDGTPINALGLSLRVKNSLDIRGYNTVEKLLAATDYDISCVRNIGIKGFLEIDAARKKYKDTGKIKYSLDIEVED